jgi:hypothetical protein
MLRINTKAFEKTLRRRAGRSLPAPKRKAQALPAPPVETPKGYIILDPSGGNFELASNIPKIWMLTSSLKKWGFPLTVALDIKRNLSDPLGLEYWETWEFVLREALLIDSKGIQWILQEDEQRRVWVTPR